MLEWLGIVWNLADSSISIPRSRIDKLISSLQELKLRLPIVTPRFLASCVGKIISLSPVVGNIAIIMTRFLQSAVNFREQWDTQLDPRGFQFYQQCLVEVDFWFSSSVRLNNRFLFSYSKPIVVVHSDASAFACGGHALVLDSAEFELFFQAFSTMESFSDSNGRELLAILYSLKSFRSLIEGKVVKIYTDNRNAAIITRKGSMSLRLHKIALDIFHFCASHQVTLEVEWVPRQLNEYADLLSRVVDYDDWTVSDAFFIRMSSLLGPFSVDCFASRNSAKCVKFYSKFWCPGTQAVDTFSVDWFHDNNWLVPPIYLIPRTVFHLEA